MQRFKTSPWVRRRLIQQFNRYLTYQPVQAQQRLLRTIILFHLQIIATLLSIASLLAPVIWKSADHSSHRGLVPVEQLSLVIQLLQVPVHRITVAQSRCVKMRFCKIKSPWSQIQYPYHWQCSGTATINLAGGRLRLRDDASPTADFNNTTVTYGNNVTLSASSFLDANRQTSTTAVGNIINLGTLNVPSGAPVLNVDSGNTYQVGFANLTGAGSLIKGSNSRLNINAIDPTFTGGLGLAGPVGLAQQPAFNTTTTQNLVLPATANVASFELGGFYITEPAKALNVAGTFTVASNAGDIASNSSNVSGRLAVTNTTTLTAGTFVNNGLVGPAGGTATISATTGFSGSGSFVARGNQLNLDGAGITGPIKVVGDNVVNANGTNHNLNNVEVQSGVLQIAPLGPATSSVTSRSWLHPPLWPVVQQHQSMPHLVHFALMRLY